jgi:hypothetical protein
MVVLLFQNIGCLPELKLSEYIDVCTYTIEYAPYCNLELNNKAVCYWAEV